MGVEGQAVSRHLIFVLEDQTVVVQRGANLVETLHTQEPRGFTSHDHHHDITDEELRHLQRQHLVLRFDARTVWLPQPQGAAPDAGRARYFYLDTLLSAPYLRIVQSLLRGSDYNQDFFAQLHGNRVAIMGANGEPFDNLNDAEASLTLLRQALGQHLNGLHIARLDVDTTLFDSQLHPPIWRDQLISAHFNAGTMDYTLMIVDESPEDANQLYRDLEGQFQVRLAHHGRAALEILMDDEPDLLILTLSLPDIHGYELLAQMKRNPLTMHIPVIVLSTNHTERDIAFALYVAKVNEYFVKPVEPTLLRQRVIHLLTKQYH